MSTPRGATTTDASTDDASRRAVATLVFVVFVDLLGFSVIIPILPFYVRSFGVSDVFIGLLAATYSLTQFASAPLLGRISDERGRRPVIVLSLSGAAVAWVVFGFAEVVWLLFLARAIAGAMGGNLAAAQAYVADVTPPERRAGALGLLGAAFGLGFVFGPALGGLFASEGVVAVAARTFPAWVPATSYSVPSFAAAALSTLAAVLAFAFLPEPDRTVNPTARRSFVGLFVDAFRSDALRGLVVAFFLWSVAFSGVQVMFIPFVADAYGYDESQAALLLTFIGVCGVVVQGVLAGRLSTALGSDRLAVVAAVGLTAALALLPFSPDVGGVLPAPGGPDWVSGGFVVLLAVLALLAFGNGLLSVALNTLVSGAAAGGGQGRAFGVTQGAGSLGRTVGPPVMAALYAVGARWLPFVTGTLLLAPVVFLLARAATRRTAGLSAGGRDQKE